MGPVPAFLNEVSINRWRSFNSAVIFWFTQAAKKSLLIGTQLLNLINECFTFFEGLPEAFLLCPINRRHGDDPLDFEKVTDFRNAQEADLDERYQIRGQPVAQNRLPIQSDCFNYLK